MEEDAKFCEDIINAKNPFQCFDLPAKYTDPAVIRSLYLKIAVKIHPDKNPSNLATQAFQVREIVRVLLNYYILIQGFISIMHSK